MLKELYNAIKTHLESIVDTNNVPVLKLVGMWNNQWEYEEKGSPLRFPCVYVEFLSLPWVQLGKFVQQSSAIIRLHVGSESMDPQSTVHLELLDIITKRMAGFQGTNFGTFTRQALEVDHNHDKLITHVFTFRTRITDLSAVHGSTPVFGDIFNLSFSTNVQPTTDTTRVTTDNEIYLTDRN